MKLIATKPLLYAGQSLNVGDEFEASEKDAKLLKAIRKAEDAPEVAVEAAPAVVAVTDDKPKRGRPKKVANEDGGDE
ncbi:DUF7210 family protein [Bosea thiooxidans]